MAVKFYDVKSRESVSLDEKSITKTTYERKLKGGAKQVRYAFRGNYKGRKLTKFCSKKDWDKLNVPVE